MVKEQIKNIIEFIFNLFSGIISRIVIAVIILLIGFIIARILSRISGKSLRKINLDSIIRKYTFIKFSVEELISNLILYVIYFFSVILALNNLGLAKDLINTLAIVILVFLSMLILFSLKDIVPNMISGLIINQRGCMKEGDIIEIDGIKGKIIKQSLLDTTIETKNKDIIVIPNTNLTCKKIIKKKKL